MSTQIETGQTYAPSAQPSGRFMPWLVGAVLAAVAIAAILTVSARVGNETESVATVNGAGLTKAEQASADRLAGLSAASASAFSPELARALQAQADRLTGSASQFDPVQSEYVEDTAIIPVEVNVSGPGWIGQDAGLDEAGISALASSSVLTPVISQQMQGFVERLTRQEVQATATVDTFSPEAVKKVLGASPGLFEEPTIDTFSPEAVPRLGTSPGVWVEPEVTASDPADYHYLHQVR